GRPPRPGPGAGGAVAAIGSLPPVRADAGAGSARAAAARTAPAVGRGWSERSAAGAAPGWPDPTAAGCAPARTARGSQTPPHIFPHGAVQETRYAPPAAGLRHRSVAGPIACATPGPSRPRTG